MDQLLWSNYSIQKNWLNKFGTRVYKSQGFMIVKQILKQISIYLHGLLNGL